MTDHDKSSNYPHLRQMQRIVWTEHCTLSSHARSIAAYLLNRMTKSYDGAFPCVERICSDMGLGRNTVIKYTKEIVDSRLFERSPGRRGMYTYKVRDIDTLADLLDAKLGEYAKAFWADGPSPSMAQTGPPEGPVHDANRSTPQTGTGPRRKPVPVCPVNTERTSVSARHIGTPSRGSKPPLSTPLPPSSDRSQNLDLPIPGGGGSTGSTDSTQSGVENSGLPWIEEANIDLGAGGVGRKGRKPITRSGPLYYDPPGARLMLVNNPAGLALYQALRDDFPIEVIKQGLMAASAKAVRAPADTLGGLLRQYCGYALEKLNGRPGQQSAPSWATYGGGPLKL